MIVLDTDHLSVLQHQGSRADEQLRRRLRDTHQEVATTIVSYEEQVRSWINQIGQQRTVTGQVPFYQRLRLFTEFYGEWELLPFDSNSAQLFEQLRQQRVRISTSDLKIATIVLHYDGTLLSRNIFDFNQVPGLRVENWLA